MMMELSDEVLRDAASYINLGLDSDHLSTDALREALQDACRHMDRQKLREAMIDEAVRRSFTVSDMASIVWNMEHGVGAVDAVVVPNRVRAEYRRIAQEQAA